MNTGQPIVVNTPLLTDKNAIVSTVISGDFISNNTYGIALKTQNGFVMSQRIFMYNSNYELFITGN